MSEKCQYSKLTSQQWDTFGIETYQNWRSLEHCLNILWKTYGSGNQPNRMYKLQANMYNICTQLEEALYHDFSYKGDGNEENRKCGCDVRCGVGAPKSRLILDNNENLRSLGHFFSRTWEHPESPDTIICPEKKPTRLPRIISELQKEYIINILNNTMRILNRANELNLYRKHWYLQDAITETLNMTTQQIDFITEL